MTTHVTGPPPPFDPELAPVLDVLTSIRPPDAYRPDTIVEMRRPVPGVPVPTDDVLSRDGAYLVRERTVPGPDGEPDLALLVCLPRPVRTPVPAIYFIHGGGMIVGDNRFGLPEALDWLNRWARRWSRSSTGSRQKLLIRVLSRTAVSAGYRSTPTNAAPGCGHQPVRRVRATTGRRP